MAQCACFGSIVQPELYIFSLRNSTTTTSTTTICFFFILHYLRMCYQISPAKPPPNEITEIRVDVMTKKSSSYFSLWPPFWAINKLWFVFNKYYRTCAIVSRSLHNLNPIFELQSNLFSGLFSIKFCYFIQERVIMHTLHIFNSWLLLSALLLHRPFGQSM